MSAAKLFDRVLAMRCDVSDEAAVERAFAETVSALGRVDACFVNAGVPGRRGVASFHGDDDRGLGSGPTRSCRAGSTRR